MHLLYHITGLDNPNGSWYLLWSGFAGGFASVIGVITVMIGAYRLHKCHQHSCWRLGRFWLDDTPYKLCHKHHPHVPKRVKV